MKWNLLSHIIPGIKKFFIIQSYRFVCFVKWWYTLTMKLTKIHSTQVRYYQTFEQIPNDYGWGRRYRKDPLNGKLDYLTHPSKLAHNAANELEFGDCDDHAIFWCTALLKNGLAKRAWFCFYSMEGIDDGRMSAHAVCVFEHADKDMFFWCDYQLPSCLDEFRDKWMQRSADTLNARPIVGAMIEVKHVTGDDTPVFGKITILKN